MTLRSDPELNWIYHLCGHGCTALDDSPKVLLTPSPGQRQPWIWKTVSFLMGPSSGLIPRLHHQTVLSGRWFSLPLILPEALHHHSAVGGGQGEVKCLATILLRVLIGISRWKNNVEHLVRRLDPCEVRLV